MKTKIKYRYVATRGGYVTIVTPTGITLGGDITQELYTGETGKPVQAIPKRYTLFSGWSDGVKSNPRTDTAGKEKGKYVTVFALFRMKPVWQIIVEWVQRR